MKLLILEVLRTMRDVARDQEEVDWREKEFWGRLTRLFEKTVQRLEATLTEEENNAASKGRRDQ